MSKFNKFEDFMEEVINEAEIKCVRKYHKSLAAAYDVNASIIKMITTIINGGGWFVFVALVALLVLGPIAFGGALLAFIATPTGIIVVGLLATVGGVTAIRLLYRNRVLPIAIKETGEMYKDEFKRHVNETAHINSLISRASDTLLNKATCLL